MNFVPNFKKQLFSFLIVVCLVALTMVTVSAGDPGLNGKNYVISTKITNQPRIYFTHLAVNNTATPDSVTYSVSRELYFEGSISGTVEATAVVYKCAVTAEVTLGVKTAVTSTCQWTIDPYKSVTCRYGSALVKTTGIMETWFNGRLTSSRNVNSNYTYASYSDKYYN